MKRKIHSELPGTLPKIKNDLQTDADAIKNSRISITPCKANMLKEEVYEKLKDKKLEVLP